MSRKATQEMTPMNVRELIESLESIEDKSLPVQIGWVDGDGYDVHLAESCDSFGVPVLAIGA